MEIRDRQFVWKFRSRFIYYSEYWWYAYGQQIDNGRLDHQFIGYGLWASDDKFSYFPLPTFSRRKWNFQYSMKLFLCGAIYANVENVVSWSKRIAMIWESATTQQPGRCTQGHETAFTQCNHTRKQTRISLLAIAHHTELRERKQRTFWRMSANVIFCHNMWTQHTAFSR